MKSKKRITTDKKRERRDFLKHCHLDLLKLLYDYQPEGIQTDNYKFSAKGFWFMTITQTTIPNIRNILRRLKEHAKLFTPAENQLIQEYDQNFTVFVEDWNAGNHSPRCVLVPKGMDEMLVFLYAKLF